MTDKPKPKFQVPEYFDRFDQKEIDDILSHSHELYVKNRARELAKNEGFDKMPGFYDRQRGVTNSHVFEAINYPPKNWDVLAKEFERESNYNNADINALMYALMAFKDDENHDACIFIRNRFQEMNKLLLQLRRRKPTEEERKLIDGFQAKSSDWNWWYRHDQKDEDYTVEKYVHGNQKTTVENEKIDFDDDNPWVENIPPMPPKKEFEDQLKKADQDGN